MVSLASLFKKSCVVFTNKMLIVLLIILFVNGCNRNEHSVGNSTPRVVDFNMHVKPILSDRCFNCHGPDSNERKAGLRLDQEEGAKETRLESGGYAIVPGNTRKSKLVQRILSEDPDEKMPPAESNLSLSPEEISILSRWIEQGGEYKPHWSLIPVVEPELPAVKNAEWIINPIDQFVGSKLEDLDLKPEPEADKETLLRRVTLDLTGLPPTIEEIDAFLADNRKEAYEEVVDRLMQSDAYAERMAMEWLDVARYADSHGYSLDGSRTMWPWRDWVIDAFSQNMPYDQFITQQIAGDLLPDATRQQRLATAFLRNQRLNAEGGIVPAEYMVEYAVDRTVTTSTAFLGITMECARCHDHKYDPISQRDFYEMYAFFNSVDELGEIRGDGNDGPQVLMMSDETEAVLLELEEEIDTISDEMKQRAEAFREEILPDINVPLEEGLISRLDFDQPGEQDFIDREAPSRKFTFTGDNIREDGHMGMALKFTPFDALEYPVEFAAFDRADPFSFSFWVKPHSTSGNISLLMKNAGKNDSQRGYEVSLYDNRLSVQLISSYPANRIEVRTEAELPSEKWTHVVVSYSGSGEAGGVQLFLNGRQAGVETIADKLTQSMVSTFKHRPLRIGWKRMYQIEVDQGYALMDELRIYNRDLSALEAALLHNERLQIERQDAEMKRLHYLTQQDERYLKLKDSRSSFLRERNSIQDTLSGVMVMGDLRVPRPTYILDRGRYDAPKERVFPSMPASILAFDEKLPQNRLGLAYWLIDENNPLTSRVAVNRYWQMFFGRGLVETIEDFGNQGMQPSHPQLLDWLAYRFMQSGWDIRSIQKLLVLSSTYRQSSTTSASKRALDPENEWLSRGPRFRLPAEMLRDQALAASGLLVAEVGGPSVKPYQPPGLWAEKSEFTELNEYIPDEGPDGYRRAMYTFWRRTSPPPSMILFDAPTRDVCTVRRQQTSTPFQALVLLNDPQFVEAAQALTKRIMAKHPGEVSEQLVLAYRLLTGVHPDVETLDLLTELYEIQYSAYREDQGASMTLFNAAGLIEGELEPARFAAMNIVCNTMMSLQESVTKL